MFSEEKPLLQTDSLYHLHRNIFEKMKKKAQSFETKRSKELRRYLEDQKYYNQRKTKICQWPTFIESLINSQVIYIGDFHTFDQNLRNVLRIMKLLKRNKKKFVIGLEMAKHEDQLTIDAFLQKEITEREFLEDINYSESWRFPWSHYQAIFKFAGENEIPISALNIEGTLKERDDYAAEIIGQHLLTDPLTPLLIFYGELHVLPNKIPRKVMELMAPETFRHTILHQNTDEVYWEHYPPNEQEGLYQYTHNEFCLMSSPPWFKYESQIYWFEGLNEDPDYDYHEYIMTHGLKLLGENIHDNFLIVTHAMSTSLALPIKDDEMENFNLYGHSHTDIVEEKIQELPSTLARFLSSALIENRSFRIPGTHDFYCSNYSFNRLNVFSGTHLFYLLLKKQKIDDLKVLSKGSTSEKFILLLLEKIYSYFFSKILNHYKKCDLYKDFVQKRDEGSQQQRQLYQTVIQLIDEPLWSDLYFQRKKLSSLESISNILGPYYGEYLLRSFQDESKKIKMNQFIIQFELNFDYINKLRELITKNQSLKMQKKRFF